MNEWITWYGGSTPWMPERIDVRMRAGGEQHDTNPRHWRWDHKGNAFDVVAYRKHTQELEEPTMIDKSNISTVLATARAEVAAESQKKAVDALKVKLRALASAKAIAANLEREVKDLEASIEDGSFAV